MCLFHRYENINQECKVFFLKMSIWSFVLLRDDEQLFMKAESRFYRLCYVHVIVV